MLEEVVDVTEAIRSEAIRLRISATARISAMDVLIAATASSGNATLIHRDPHFAVIPKHLCGKKSCRPSEGITRFRRRVGVLPVQPALI